jgi:LacI family transcriptional regulator
MHPTIKDVAKRANLSVSTVSRAINRSGYVSNETQQLVDSVVAELDYQPNWMAQGLAGNRSRLIGLVIPDIFNPHYTSIARSLFGILQQQQYGVILCLNNESRETDLGYLRVFREKHVDGIIYVHPANGSNSAFVRQLASEGMPIVELNRQRESDILDAVLADDFHGSYEMTKYLLGKGHRRIGLVIGEAEISTGKDRIAGYRRALKDTKISIDADLIRVGSFTREHGERGTNELLMLNEPPTAIFAGSNRILMGVLDVLVRQRGLSIPGDVSVVAFNDAEWLSVWNPAITVVDIAAEEMARLTVEVLLGRIRSPERKRKPVTYHLSTFLIERGSCKDMSSSKPEND